MRDIYNSTLEQKRSNAKLMEFLHDDDLKSDRNEEKTLRD